MHRLWLEHERTIRSCVFISISFQLLFQPSHFHLHEWLVLLFSSIEMCGMFFRHVFFQKSDDKISVINQLDPFSNNVCVCGTFVADSLSPLISIQWKKIPEYLQKFANKKFTMRRVKIGVRARTQKHTHRF